MQRRQSDQAYGNDLTSLATAAATVLQQRPENRDMTEFRAIYGRLRPGDPNWQEGFNNVAVLLLNQEMEFSGRNAVQQRIANNTDGMNVALENGRQAAGALAHEFGDATAERRMVSSFLGIAAEEGQRRGLNDEQVKQVQQDMLMAAVDLHFDVAAVVGGAVDAGVQFDPPTRRMVNPTNPEDEAHNVLDMIRINAMIQSGENIRRINDLTNQITAERDPRARRQLEEERNERSRELTRMMGAEEGVKGRRGEGEVAISETAALAVVNTHMDLVNRLHTGQLDQVVLSKRPPQMVG